QVEDVVVDLVSRAETEAEGAQGADHIGRSFVDESAELAGRGKKRGGLHLDDLVVIRHAELQVEAPLRLDDLTAADFAGSVGDAAADFAILEAGGELESVGEEAVAEKDADGVAPLGVGGGLAAALVGTVEDVVVNERGGVDQ